MLSRLLFATLLLAIYVALALSPLVIAALAGLRPRPFLDDLSSRIAMHQLLARMHGAFLAGA